MRVIHYYPWGYCYPITCGSDHVACNQLDYLRARGYEVDFVFSNKSHKPWAEERFRERFGWLSSVTHLHVPWSHHFRDLLFLYEQARRNPAFERLCSRPADLFFTNYAFTTPLVSAVPPSCKRVVEMVDLMSIAFTQHEERQAGSAANKDLAEARQRFLFGLEIELCRTYDRVIMLNPNEYERARLHLGDRVVHVPQCVPDPGSPPDRLDDQPDDLLFVGSGHPPNTIGLDWFYRRVYVPYLLREGVRMTVVGSVCEQVSFPEGHRVTKLRQVDGPLIDVYRRAKLVIVPLFEGTGMSIKTIESLAMGCPVVASSVGARGLPDSTDAVVQVDIPGDPRGVARVIRDLLSSPAKRRALRVAARSLYEQHYHPYQYQARMNQVLDLK